MFKIFSTKQVRTKKVEALESFPRYTVSEVLAIVNRIKTNRYNAISERRNLERQMNENIRLVEKMKSHVDDNKLAIRSIRLKLADCYEVEMAKHELIIETTSAIMQLKKKLQETKLNVKRIKLLAIEQSLGTGKSKTEVIEPSLGAGKSKVGAIEPSFGAGKSKTEVIESSLGAGKSKTEVNDPSLGAGKSKTRVQKSSVRRNKTTEKKEE
ncbi:MAG: hypothetical protein ACK5IJ_11895 [Mangrovibacterium sp.]